MAGGPSENPPGILQNGLSILPSPFSIHQPWLRSHNEKGTWPRQRTLLLLMKPPQGRGRSSHTLSRCSAPWPLGRHRLAPSKCWRACCLLSRSGDRQPLGCSVRLPHGPFYIFTTRVDVAMGRAEASPGRQGPDRPDPHAPTASASSRALLFPVTPSQGGLPRHSPPARSGRERGKPFIVQGGLGGTGEKGSGACRLSLAIPIMSILVIPLALTSETLSSHGNLLAQTPPAR